VQAVCICGCIYDLQNIWKLVYEYRDIISWAYGIYLMMDLAHFDVSVLVWHVLNWGGYQVM